MNILKYIPKKMQEEITTEGTALITNIQDNFDLTEEEIINLRYLKNPEKCPEEFLEILGNYVQAGIKNTDTERQKRYKIENAVAGHKTRYYWSTIKALIDGITGGDARIINRAYTDLWAHTSTDRYWAYNYSGMTSAAVSTFGMRLYSGGNNANVSGNIYIDVGVIAVPTTNFTDESCYLNDNALGNDWSTYTNYAIGDLGFQYYNGTYFWNTLNDLLVELCPAYFYLHVGYLIVDTFQEVLLI